MSFASKLLNNFPENFPIYMNGKLSCKIRQYDYVQTDGTSGLYVQVSLTGVKSPKKIPLLIDVRKKDFDKIGERVQKSNLYYQDYNLLIEKKLAEITRIELNYRLSSVPITLDSLSKELENPSSRIDFISFWEAELVNQKTLNLISDSTHRQQSSALRKLKKYKKELFFYEITEEFISKMKAHLAKKEGNEETTISSFIKNFKKYLHIANKRGIITPIQYDDIKHKGFKSQRTFLMPDEIQILYKYWKNDFINATHKAILARFLFSCFTSLRISDNLALSEENFMGDFIAFSSQKTGKFQRIALSNSAKTFMNDGLLIGKFTPEYINRELKFIAKAVGIRKNISFHVSRHTFATNYLISGGRVENLQKILGHYKIEETMIYVHIVESIVDNEIMTMDEILNF
ncbi:tyrosine-type recombinase/integrase [Flavobacterium sp. 3HN19-14]|uniref:tyrosine-type recombinase/integrase n=1 Tax=Flavobacterium sp. 3HN19-14 TaxID=3448133 RepID=UPI003EE1DF29